MCQGARDHPSHRIPHALHRCLSLIIITLAVLPARAQPADAPQQQPERLGEYTPVPVFGQRSVDEEFNDLLDIDSLFYVDNQGLERLVVTINDGTFTLTSDSTELGLGANTFYFPAFGAVTVHIGAYLVPGDTNYVRLRTRGPEGSQANIVIADLMLTDRIHYTLTELDPIPEALALTHNFPNPFSEQTTITYQIPDARIDGVEVTLAIYDVRGRLVRRLVDGTRFPGTFAVPWNGTNDAGRRVASGVYVYRLQADAHQETATLVLVR